MHTPLGRSLRERAARDPDRRAFVFLGDGNAEVESLTCGQLHHAARALSVRLARRAPAGQRVLLMFHSGLAFVLAFFACHYAGLVPVPVVPPSGRRVRDAVAAISADCGAALALTSEASEATVRAFFEERPAGARPVEVLALALQPWLDAGGAPDDAPVHEPVPDEIAFIQYTSGSTSAPKGVVVTHRNLLANLEMMAVAFGNDAASTHVGWAPLYHDMGLIANVLQPFYVGALCVLMSPAQFAQAPWLWLRAISDYKARVSGGPNFAYELCVQRARRALAQPLDLSGWRLAFNSAEPVKARTLAAFTEAFGPAGFRGESFYPCYGLADATLLVSGGRVGQAPVLRRLSRTGLEAGRAAPPADAADGRTLVGAGRALRGETIAIVGPDSLRLLEEGQVGEVWVSGPNVPAAYWAMPRPACEAVFGAQLAQHPGMRFLRTGDLGFLDGGELFITGRLKDVLIVRGRNIYPQDIEAIAQAAAPGLRANAGAAFSFPRDGTQAVALVQEVDRAERREDTAPAVAAIRRAVFHELDVSLHDIVLVRPGTVPRTSSGKVRRSEARLRYLRGDFAPAAAHRHPGDTPLDSTATSRSSDGNQAVAVFPQDR